MKDRKRVQPVELDCMNSDDLVAHPQQHKSYANWMNDKADAEERQKQSEVSSPREQQYMRQREDSNGSETHRPVLVEHLLESDSPFDLKDQDDHTNESLNEFDHAQTPPNINMPMDSPMTPYRISWQWTENGLKPLFEPSQASRPESKLDSYLENSKLLHEVESPTTNPQAPRSTVMNGRVMMSKSSMNAVSSHNSTQEFVGMDDSGFHSMHPTVLDKHHKYPGPAIAVNPDQIDLDNSVPPPSYQLHLNGVNHASKRMEEMVAKQPKTAMTPGTNKKRLELLEKERAKAWSPELKKPIVYVDDPMSKKQIQAIEMDGNKTPESISYSQAFNRNTINSPFVNIKQMKPASPKKEQSKAFARMQHEKMEMARVRPIIQQAMLPPHQYPCMQHPSQSLWHNHLSGDLSHFANPNQRMNMQQNFYRQMGHAPNNLFTVLNGQPTSYVSQEPPQSS
ncbi:hypothetical protein Ciccas_000489 [Cichlidogyrus casuarinus]|uniref:Uncharacterized protein n=1 Tax=Cichlidogyrus casuarinus TaxID=1844966 RepID=A0ABD2QN59_9PLAT